MRSATAMGTYTTNTKKSTVRPIHAAAARVIFPASSGIPSDCVHYGGKKTSSPNGMSREPGGSHHFQRNTGDVIGVHELLEAVKQHGNGDEVARDRFTDQGAARILLVAEARGQRQRTAGREPQRPAVSAQRPGR